MKSLNCILVLLFLLVFQANFFATENNQQNTIKVGVYDNPPKIFINENGNADGIFIDVIKSIAKTENLKIEFVNGDWLKLTEMLKRGEIDILPDVAYSQERDSIFTLNKLPVLGSWLEVFTTKKSKINSISDLQNKRIGVLKGSIQENYVTNIVKKDFDLEFEIIVFDNYTNSIKSLKNQEIDLIVADRFFYFSELYDDEILSTGIILRPTELLFAFPKNNKELANIFDKNISLLKNNSKSEYYISLHKWLDKGLKSEIPMFVIWIIASIIFVLIIVSVFAFLLQYRVKQKTKELTLQNELLIVLKEKAEESNRLKTSFLQNISHEIRTPLNAICGFSGMLSMPDLTDDKKNNFISIIQNSSNQLLAIVNDVLTISSLQNKQEKINIQEVCINEIIDDLHTIFNQQAKNQNINLVKKNGLTNNQSLIYTDRTKIIQILTNLLSNALKFTKMGEIEFGYIVDDVRTGRDLSLRDKSLQFYVKDTGIGINSEFHEKIFERFSKADKNIQTNYGGTGLGLSISKGFVELLGGKIWLNSEDGKGTTFYFTIPYKPISQIETTEILYPKFENRSTILVAEDEEYNFMYIEELLNRINLNIIRTKDGKETVEMCKSNPNISLILMDIKMPIMDGFEATKLIKEFRPNLPIIAHTAYALEQEIEFYSGVFDDYITKPTKKDELFQKLNKHISIN